MIYTYYKNIGNNILLRYKEGNKTVSKKVDFYKPTLYNKSQSGTKKTIYDEPVKEIPFNCIRDAKDFAKQYKDVDGFEIQGNSNYANQFIIELLEGKPPEYNPTDIRGGILDIEVHAEEMPKADNPVWPITAITVYDTVTKVYSVFGLRHTSDNNWLKKNADNSVKDLDIDFKIYSSERDLLNDFISYMKQSAFDYTSGWNSELFDIPYIVARCTHLLGEKATSQLSPFNKIDQREIRANFGKVETKYDIVGVPHLDFMHLYKKHIFVPRASYKLGNIAHDELGTTKLSYEEEGNLRNLYEQNFQLYIDYNIVDVKLIKQLNDKLGLFELTFALAYYTLSNYEDTLGTVKIWEQLIAKFLYTKGIVPPFSRKQQESKEFEGAYVRDPVVGMHKWLMSFDLQSLYPHIEQQVNIGIETFVDPSTLPDEVLELKKYKLIDLINEDIDTSVLKEHNLSMSASFDFYRKDKMSIPSEIKRELYSMRKVYKKEMLKSEQIKANIKNELHKRGVHV